MKEKMNLPTVSRREFLFLFFLAAQHGGGGGAAAGCSAMICFSRHDIILVYFIFCCGISVGSFRPNQRRVCFGVRSVVMLLDPPPIVNDDRCLLSTWATRRRAN